MTKIKAKKFREVPEKMARPEVEEKKTAKNKLIRAINYLKEKYDFRYNLINTETEFKLKDAKEYIYFGDREYKDVLLDLKINGKIDGISRTDFESIIYGSSISVAYNPLKDYLFSLPKWDGKTDYITEYLQQVYLTNEENRQYFIDGFKKWFVALVMALVEDEPSPYKINQVCLVLVGDQAKYKTTFLKNLVPQHLQLKYYYGSTFQMHEKDHEKYLAYKMLINMDEMAALKRADIESIKSRITQDQVVIRLPYAKADIYLKRRASFCGSVNNPEYLFDQTGTRRFLTIEVKNIVFNKNLDIDNLYVQALALHKSGFRYWFESEEIKKIEVHNQDFIQKSFEEEMLLKYFQIPDANDFKTNSAEWLSATDIANFFRSIDNGICINNSVVRNIGAALKKNKFYKQSRRINNNPNPRYLWVVKKIREPKTYPPNEIEIAANYDYMEDPLL